MTPRERARRAAASAGDVDNAELLRAIEREVVEAAEEAAGLERARLVCIIEGAGDADERERAEAEPAEPISEGEFSQLVADTSQAVLVHDVEGRYVAANENACQLLGYTREEFLGMTISQVTKDFNPHYYEILLRKLEAGPDVSPGVYVRKNGSLLPVRLLMSLIEVGGRALVVDAFRDATESQIFGASHDGLTGVYKRDVLITRAGLAVDRAARTGKTSAAVLYLDLDDFKEVNDSFGHPVGDELLVEVAGRLQKAVRPGDTLARMGGDEMAVLLEGLRDLADAEAVAERIRESLGPPFDVASRKMRVAASIGIALCRPDYDDAQDLIRDADTAMYHAKSRGRDRYVVFAEEMARMDRPSRGQD